MVSTQRGRIGRAALSIALALALNGVLPVPPPSRADEAGSAPPMAQPTDDSTAEDAWRLTHQMGTGARAVTTGEPASGVAPQSLEAATELAEPLTVHLYAGSMGSRVQISNPAGITGIHEHITANFAQRILSQTHDTVVLEIISSRVLDTRAPFPVSAGSLPDEVLGHLAPRPDWIQSDAPEIQALAADLARGAVLQSQAVDAIFAWVRAQIVYDFDGPRDASSVLATGRAYCVGYANLAMALLRAAGVPARAQYGAVGGWDGWSAPLEGGRHVWVEVYYADLGWVASDPQVTSNMLDTAHVVGFLDQSGRPGTQVIRLGGYGGLNARDEDYMFSVRANVATRSGLPLHSANVPGWDRSPLTVQPTSVTVVLGDYERKRTISLDVSSPEASGWRVESGSPWLVPMLWDSSAPSSFSVEVDGDRLAPGTHVGTLSVLADGAERPAAGARTVTVTVEMRGPAPQPDPLSFTPTHWMSLPLVFDTR